MQNWKIINDDYLNYLRKFESRIPKTDYGNNKIKPFFGELMTIEDIVYVTQVSSPKERHQKLKQALDFYKLHNGNNFIAVVNLNFMFPVPKSEIKDLNYKNIDNYVNFPSKTYKNNYIALLKTELKIINQFDLHSAAQKLYDLKSSDPHNKISQRCLDFKLLESYALSYQKELQTV